jgi:hypothetical protein
VSTAACGKSHGHPLQPYENNNLMDIAIMPGMYLALPRTQVRGNENEDRTTLAAVAPKVAK